MNYLFVFAAYISLNIDTESPSYDTSYVKIWFLAINCANPSGLSELIISIKLYPVLSNMYIS